MAVRIFFASAFGFFVGVFAASYVPLGTYEAAFCVVLACALSLCAWLSSTRDVAVLACAFLACAFGVLRMDHARLVPEETLERIVNQKIVVEGVVFEEPDVRERSIRISVAVERMIYRSATTSISAGILVIAPLHVGIEYGDVIRAEGTLRRPESFDAGAGHASNYPMFLAKDNLQYELSFANIEKISEGSTNPIKSVAIWIKQTYLSGLALALPEPQAGLAGGITAGDKRALGDELTDMFRTVGLIHIVVLSGYNIMVVVRFLDRIVRPRPIVVSIFGRAHRNIRASLGIAVAIFFALITGLASSSVRAAAMAIIATIGKASGRTYLATRALTFVAFGMALWNPYVLAFDPGFQLSVIATAGLIHLSPRVADHLTFLTERFGFREIAATTIGTQLAVLPLLLFQSGQLSLIALPANLLALIAVPYAMLASFIAGVAGLIAGPLAPLVGFPAYVLLSYILFVAEWAARIPFSSVAIGMFPATLVAFSYLAMIIFVRQKIDPLPPPNSHS